MTTSTITLDEEERQDFAAWLKWYSDCFYLIGRDELKHIKALSGL